MTTTQETDQSLSNDSDTDSSTDTPTDADNAGESTTEAGNNEPETFPRSYVEKLRQESAEHRNKAKKADLLAQRLVTALVAKIGTLHDATDLPYDENLLDDDGMPDEGKINEAVKQLASIKPHLVKIRPVGDVGQGSSSTQPSTSLLDVIQGR